MKIYISADMEGIVGTTAWDEVNRTHADYEEFRRQMTREVAAACKGALDAGADRIVVRDAHDSARNLIAADLPEPVELIRGWNGHPYMMMDDLDPSFDAAMMIGYHSMAATDRSPLAHTMSSSKLAGVYINELQASEFLLNTYTAALEKVPVIFISGDQGICDHARQVLPQIVTAPVKRGLGEATINLHPQLACDLIQKEAKNAVNALSSAVVPELPKFFEVKLVFSDFKRAHRFSFYPGARRLSNKEVEFETTSYMDVLRLFLFI